jgi:hypothetical protein
VKKLEARTQLIFKYDLKFYRCAVKYLILWEVALVTLLGKCIFSTRIERNLTVTTFFHDTPLADCASQGNLTSTVQILGAGRDTKDLYQAVSIEIALVHSVTNS